MGWRGFGFVHHSRTVFCRAVPNPNLTIRNFSSLYGVGWRAQFEGGGGAHRRVPHHAEEELPPPRHRALAVAKKPARAGGRRQRRRCYYCCTAMQKLRIVRLGFGTARQKTVLE
jgi:hypothetical protein